MGFGQYVGVGSGFDVGFGEHDGVGCGFRVEHACTLNVEFATSKMAEIANIEMNVAAKAAYFLFIFSYSFRLNYYLHQNRLAIALFKQLWKKLQFLYGARWLVPLLRVEERWRHRFVVSSYVLRCFSVQN